MVLIIITARYKLMVSPSKHLDKSKMNQVRTLKRQIGAHRVKVPLVTAAKYDKLCACTSAYDSYKLIYVSHINYGYSNEGCPSKSVNCKP